MRTIIALIVLMFVAFTSLAQRSIKEYVQQTAVPISSIDPDSTTYTDLEVIGKAIGDATIVMLGEQDHGDAPTFLAKTRLIKYLHEKKGFNVLAFESDFVALNEGWDRLPKKDKKSLDSFAMQNIFPIWTYCDACAELLYNYIPATHAANNPLILSGFDNQVTLTWSYYNLVAKLDSVLRQLDLPVTKQPAYSNEIIPSLHQLVQGFYKQQKEIAAFVKRAPYLVEIKNQAAQKLNTTDFWLMVIDNLIALNAQLQFKSDFRKSGIIRDEQMALNLKWLKENKYAGQKIIVWAANYHIARYADSLKNNPEKKLASMGYFFTKDSSLNKEIYILGFGSYSGTAGRVTFKQFTPDKPKSNSFEKWMGETNKYSFVDFKHFNQQTPAGCDPFYLKGLGHHNLKQQWNKVFDGLFFIRDMYPCKMITPTVPESKQ